MLWPWNGQTADDRKLGARWMSFALVRFCLQKSSALGFFCRGTYVRLKFLSSIYGKNTIFLALKIENLPLLNPFYLKPLHITAIWLEYSWFKRFSTILHCTTLYDFIDSMDELSEFYLVQKYHILDLRTENLPFLNPLCLANCYM